MTMTRGITCVLLTLVVSQPGCITTAMWKGYTRSVGNDELAQADDVRRPDGVIGDPAAGDPAAPDGVAARPTDDAEEQGGGAGPGDVALGALCVVATPATFALDVGLAGLAFPLVPILLLALL